MLITVMDVLIQVVRDIWGFKCCVCCCETSQLTDSYLQSINVSVWINSTSIVFRAAVVNININIIHRYEIDMGYLGQWVCFEFKYLRRTQWDQHVYWAVFNIDLSLVIFLTLAWLAGFQSYFWSFVRSSQTPQDCGSLSYLTFIVLSLLTNSLEISFKYLS